MNGNNYNNNYNNGNFNSNNNYNNQNRSYPNGNNGCTPGGYYQNPNGGKKPSGNGPIIAAVSILGALLVAVIVFIILWLTGIIGSSKQSEAAPAQTQTQTQPQAEQAAPTEPQPVAMFVANVEHSIYFRNSPSELDSNIICEIPLATQVAFIENTDAVFAKIKYNDQEGYVKREYLSATRPQPKASASSGDTTVKYSMYVVNV